MKQFWNEFKTFALKGNMLDLAVGVILGAAFGKVITSLVGDILMPPLGKLTGNVDFKDIFINLSGTRYESLAAAKQAGAPTINVGLFLNTMVDFLLVPLAVFFLIRLMNRYLLAKKVEEAKAEPSRQERLLEEIRDLLRQQNSNRN